jgi:restriction system protein
MAKAKNESLKSKCPKCGYLSYYGGYCFGCGIYRPKRPERIDREVEDAAEFMNQNHQTAMTAQQSTYDAWSEFMEDMKAQQKHGAARLRRRSVVSISEQNLSEAALLVQGVVEPYDSTSEGQLVHAFVLPWRTIVERLKKDWMLAFKIPPRMWEEMIAAAFDQDGYDEVTLTPRSGDFGRDVIAIKRGIGCVRIIGSVKAFAPGNLVRPDDVRALAGVLHGDQKASKGIITTTTDFTPNITKDPVVSPLMPYRLELMNGIKLREWLSQLTS